jgi:hypothetical protein
MILHELEYSARIAVSCALSPPDTYESIDAWTVQSHRATNTLWLLQQRVVGFYEEEKAESWRVPVFPARCWPNRFKLAVDALVEADITHLESLPTAASKYLATWNRVLLRLSKHFGILRQEYQSSNLVHRHTSTFPHSPNTAMDSTSRHRGTEGHRHQYVEGHRAEPARTV